MKTILASALLAASLIGLSATAADAQPNGWHHHHGWGWRHHHRRHCEHWVWVHRHHHAERVCVRWHW